ncbi:MAG: hypothetical protein KF889_02060 [Alphaproteobacteria bacterium]|nr:hypothetical protein [Alphaproteobacteria bacterium]MCW5741693.1 hypothetical protein [Alphaproteobacteria bacterium]
MSAVFDRILLFLSVTLQVMAPALVLAGLIVAVLVLLAMAAQRRIRPALPAFVVSSTFTVALLGFAIGYVTGNSRVSVVGEFLPAFLTLIGGIFVYVLSKDQRTPAGLATSIVFALAVSVLVSIYWGAVERDASEAAAELAKRQRAISDEEVRYQYELERVRRTKELMGIREASAPSEKTACPQNCEPKK